jgi:DeoR/GlpR family transcriptional regulator of sugar metabolism
VLHDELSCVGSGALRTLATYRFDLAVIGAAGLSARWGITELTDEEAEVQRTALERADRIVVIADGSKIGGATSAVVGAAERITTLVTDSTAPADELRRLRGAGIEIIVARDRQRPVEARVAGPAPRLATLAASGRPT